MSDHSSSVFGPKDNPFTYIVCDFTCLISPVLISTLSNVLHDSLQPLNLAIACLAAFCILNATCSSRRTSSQPIPSLAQNSSSIRCLTWLRTGTGLVVLIQHLSLFACSVFLYALLYAFQRFQVAQAAVNGGKQFP